MANPIREDFAERGRRKEKARDAWRENNKQFLEIYENYLQSIQRTRTQYSEFVLSALVLGVIVNIASSLIYDLPSLLISENWSIFSIKLFLLFIIFMIAYGLSASFYERMKQYDPPPRSMILPINFEEDMPNFIDKDTYELITAYIKSEKMIEFEEFSQRFFKTLQHWLPYAFNPHTPPMIKETKEYDDLDIEKIFPTTSQTYDLTSLTHEKTSVQMEVRITPRIIFSFGNGRQPNIRDINVDLKLDINELFNPKAVQIIKEIYWFRLGHIPQYASLAIEHSFFPLIDEINPAKIREKHLTKQSK